MTQTALVEQVDREAAAAYYYSAGGSPHITRAIREGKKDNWFRVQAFARHRIAALAIARPIIAGEALDRAAETASDLFAFAVQSDTENGVRWLNERAAAAYLKDAPATLATIKALSDAILALREQYR